ncbi:MAG: hypothetical protein COV76_05890 [Candidatus Omnitrophica bacterium CG11_big_fil_rev_8_21_14_0_20_64_10]|nr:MAG: hypothetical protein COV76_05890 [Candidatus Omnitrophica bacterium CG11_big_fil_rev_8_21_14_0_20_64_10]
MENIHPLFVHFPIALLLTAFGVETVLLVAPALRRPGWDGFSFLLLIGGTAAATAAVITGRMAAETAKHSMEIHRIMELHGRLGFVVLGLAAVAAGCRLLKKDHVSARLRWIAWGLLGAACGAMVFGAHLGGRLVYEFGVGGSYGRSGGIQVIDHAHQ